MFKNYIKFAFRNLIRQKLYAFINISGLAIGITGSLLILTYVFHELSYENFHEKRDRIYRAAIEFGSGGNSMKLAGAMPALAPAAVNQLPEVTEAVRFYRDHNALLSHDDQSFAESRFYFADPSVFEVFSFDLLAGRSADVLTDPFSLVISERMAEKYFAGENALGKTLIYKKDYPLKITGIMKDNPQNTHLKCDFLVSYNTREKIAAVESPWNQFGDTYTYLFVQKNTDIENLKEQLQKLLEDNTNEHFAGMIRFHLQNLSNIYMHSKMMGELSSSGNMTYVYLFSFVAILVLIIASLNYINLSTARSVYRSKEIGMRKILGAGRLQLMRQLMGESLVFTALALGLSLILFELLFPFLNQFLGSEINQPTFGNLGFYPLIGGIFLLVSLAAGYYPALFLSRFRPVNAIKDDPGNRGGASPFRISLVVVQFVISIFLIIGVLVIREQVQFMKESSLGFEKHNVLLIPYKTGKPGAADRYSVLKNRVSAIPQVESFSGAYTVPGLMNKEQQSVVLKGADESEVNMMRAIGVDYDFVNTLGLEVVKGRAFSESFGTDRKEAVILNESAVANLGIQDETLGQELLLPGGGDGRRSVRVIGVIRDFHVRSMRSEIEPLFLYINPQRFYTLAMRYQSGSEAAVLQAIENIWTEIVPGKTFEYSFLNDTYDQLYQSEEKTGQMISIFSMLAIFVSCLGLFGLASFTVERKTKEIGIRKVLGATVTWIVFYLSRRFARWVVIASLIAWPLSWYLLNHWLQSYAYHIRIDWWIFLFAGAMALIVALLAVSYQAIRAAVANPVEALKYE